jgi:putative ABC transport system permease protein
VLNAAAATAFGFASPRQAVGQTTPDGSTIVGIAPEVRFQTLRQPSEAILYQLKPGDVLTFRSADDAQAAYRAIEPLWRRYFPNQILEVHTAQSFLTAMYDDDLRLARMLAMASAVTIVLAAFGIYVLSAYSVQRSARAIVLRKLHGARGADIAALVGGEFVLLVGAGALLGLPPAALAIQRYLAGFVDHAAIGGWTLAASLMLAALVATLATARHTLAALRLPPALALRD